VGIFQQRAEVAFERPERRGALDHLVGNPGQLGHLRRDRDAWIDERLEGVVQDKGPALLDKPKDGDLDDAGRGGVGARRLEVEDGQWAIGGEHGGLIIP